jgi:hypothetical protein
MVLRMPVHGQLACAVTQHTQRLPKLAPLARHIAAAAAAMLA